MAKENKFDPTAFKDNLPVEVVEPKTFLCHGCCNDSTGLEYQEKLCKACAVKLIAYSRKAIKAIDDIRPTTIYNPSVEMKGGRKKFQNLRYLQFIKDKKEVMAEDIALEFKTPINRVYSNLSHYKSNGLIEVAREIFVRNRIKKVYRIKTNG